MQMKEINDFINGLLQIVAAESIEDEINYRYNLMMEQWLDECDTYSAWSRDREAEIFADFH